MISIAMSRSRRPTFRTRPSAWANSYDTQLFDRAQLYSNDTRFVLSGIVNRMDRAYVSPDTLRRDQADLSPDSHQCPAGQRQPGFAAPADDADRRAQCKGRSCDRPRRRGDHLRRDRPTLARRGGLAAERAGACGKTGRKGWPARSHCAGRCLSPRDQPADLACAEIADAGFPHRLSAEGFRLQFARRRRSSRSPLENQIDRDADPGRSKPQARLQGVAARSQAFHRASIAARS